MARLRPGQKKKSAVRPAQRRPSVRASSIAFAAFAHDIRTSLTGILALGELLTSSNLGERERRWASGIKTSAEHLAALTALVVDGARADAGTLTLQQEVFRPRRLVEVLAESLEARAQNKGLDAEVLVTDDLPELLVGDAVRLRAALENLIDNAVKFTAHGAVRLEAGAAHAKNGRVNFVLTVNDSGIGLTPAEIKRLFRPFAQANADIARRYGGAGLGLAVVKRLAKLMGGDLTVSSTSGSGSRFCFTAELPLASAEAVEETRARQVLSTPARRLAILCVEDNPYGRVILNTILTELGHRADFVNSGEEAVDAVPRGYDLVLMDVTLPGIGGLEAARRIRALTGTTGAIPIIGISGRTEAGDEQAARAAGMNFYLRKPISPSGLSEALASVTAFSSGEEGATD
jgi:two-component system, sensor histidine kinase